MNDRVQLRSPSSVEGRGPSGRTQTSRRTSSVRLLLVLASALLWFGALGWRLYDIQIRQHEDFSARADRQHERLVELDAPRGAIVDRLGREMAISVACRSAFADPVLMRREHVDFDEVAGRLATVLKVDRRKLRKTLEGDGSFVWLRRRLDDATAARIEQLQIPGIAFLEESRREYPMRQVAAHALGLVGADNQGLGGVESKYDEVLRGRGVVRHFLQDARGGRWIEASALAETPTAGADVVLTIDATLQHIAEQELAQAVIEANASAGVVILLDARDSAVLAMASYPPYDANEFAAAPDEARRNRAVFDAYEPGSTFKAVTAVAALDAMAVHPDDRFDCEMGGITVRGVRIGDHKPFGVLSFREIIELSSNVGVIKSALRTGAEPLYRATRELGFGSKTGIDLPGENPGIVRAASEWDTMTTAYASFGHGLAVTPLQLANAYAALARGEWRAPYIVSAIRRNGKLESRPPAASHSLPLSKASLKETLRLLEGVVERGTGRAAALEGYLVAGKTGTAQKSSRLGYSETGRMASFVGVAPARAPRLIGLVMVDEPQGRHEGGFVAAPVFSRVVQAALFYLGVPPSRDEWPAPENLIALLPERKVVVPPPEAPPRETRLAWLLSRAGAP